VDPEFAAMFIEHGDVDESMFLRALRRGTIARAFVPVLAGAAYANRGVEPLLDAIVNYLPSPADRPAVRGVEGEERSPSDAAPLAALCFKVVHDDWGQRSFVRVYSGVLRRGDSVVAMQSGERLRVGRLARVFASSIEDVAELHAGDIGAVLGSSIASGETLADLARPIVLMAIAVLPPVISVAIEPKTRADRDRMGVALGRLLGEDPSLRVRSDPETGETTLAGMGELHLEVAIERLREAHRVEVRSSAPRVAYRETIARAVEHEAKHVKQSGGPGQFAHLKMRIEPGHRGAGVVFALRIRGGAIPAEFVPGVEKGIRLAAMSGVLGGYPVADVIATLLDGSFHPNDSSEMAFAICAEHAFREAMRAASPTLLEPVMRVTIEVSESAVGAVIGDLGKRRGRVMAIEGEDEQHRVIRAHVPLAELVGYVAALRSLTQGRGMVSTELDGYAPVPYALVASALAKT
jgi:elongation factor G